MEHHQVILRSVARAQTGLQTALLAATEGFQQSQSSMYQEMKEVRKQLVKISGTLEAERMLRKSDNGAFQVVSGQYLAQEPLSPEVNNETVAQLKERLFHVSVATKVDGYTLQEVERSQSEGSLPGLGGGVPMGQIAMNLLQVGTCPHSD